MLQTWLPYPSFRESAVVLSDSHLQQQRLHVLELLEKFHTVEHSELPDGYGRHVFTESSPIMRMWKGYEVQLAEYGLEVCEEHAVRTRREDPLYGKIFFHLEAAIGEGVDMGKPNWWGNADFHHGHQTALFVRDKRHYNQHFKVDFQAQLIWPASAHAS